MRKRLAVLGLFCLLQFAHAQSGELLVEHGKYNVYLLLHQIGTEEYGVTEHGPTGLTLTARTIANDRGRASDSTTVLETGPQFAPIRLRQGTALAEVAGASVNFVDGPTTQHAAKPLVAFVGLGSAPPAAVQMMLMRYWLAHHMPRTLTMVRPGQGALPLEIRLVGHDAFQVKGRMVRLARYTISNLIFGREVVWMNDSGRLAALMTFSGLPREEMLDEYATVAGELVHSGVQQQMLDLAELDHEVPPEMQGAYAIVGARLIDGTGAAPVEHATVVVRDGKIVSAGHVPVPAGMRVVHAEGKTLLPGLWDSHVHYSGVEQGPAWLAAGITTVRDCGGEFEFLTMLRRRLETQHALGPRMLLAGLIDSGGPLAFGSVDVRTGGDAVRAVDTYADARFDQIKVYDRLPEDLLRIVTAEAHRRGLIVTGHVPSAIDAYKGVEDGMDQINHLEFVVHAMSLDGRPLDLNSALSKGLIAEFREHGTVVDPTESWTELSERPKGMDAAAFEPGLLSAPYPLARRYGGMGEAVDEAAYRRSLEVDRGVIHALYEAGIPIIAGSDTGLPGYGLDRELELYVQAGMAPMAAIQTATLTAARAARREVDSGSIEAGKRADLVLIDGDPLSDIRNLRRVVSVVKEGRLYNSRKLARSVGFTR
ncbi:Imidazolonepropionase [Granulicella rosea]|uniref:Imidazolonepropionase n=1 Tax=Granulicella rosea TaxID=474952 RepID=A0A239KPF7_9BACT|nr:amidohydrolase family protein [Granulicella rosea]SNT19612.1 Imidazolonepropionase [Granulicella rosea]